MKKILFFLVFLGALYAVGFTAAKSFYLKKSSAQASLPKFVDHGFRPTAYPLTNRSFVIAVVGYNNGAFVEKTLRSLFSQVYPHYRIVYVDDASTDGSFSLVKDLVESSGCAESVTLTKNVERLGELANLSQIVEASEDEEIIVWVRGEDFLAHEWVLTELNAYYADPDLWMTFGQYREFPGYRLGSSAPFDRAEWEEKGARGCTFTASHLKTFYAALFKQINSEDLLYQGSYFSAAVDVAVMVPLLELARNHFQFIPDILYIAQKQYPEESELAIRSERYIRSLASYEPLPSLLSLEAVCE